MNRQTTLTLLKLTAGLSLFTGVIAFIFLIFLPAHQSNNKTSPTPTPTTGSGPTATVTIEPTGQACGFYTPKCPEGYTCSIPNNGENGGINPQGTCIKQQSRPRAKEGEFCGGVAAFQCQKGLTCKLDGDYPDAGGHCVKN